MKGYRTLILNGGIALAVALLTFLTSVDWTQYVSPSAGLFILAAANAALRFFTSTPVGKPVSPVTTINNQGGFARAETLCALIILGVLAIAITACSMTPKTPRQTLLAGYESLDAYTQAITNAKASGLIDAAERDRLVGQVRETYTFLEDARLSLAGIPNSQAVCADTASCLTAAQQLLLQIQSHLPKEPAK
jgi:hypothetical protein